MCNKEIKFGLFYDWAMENGFDFVATGHYAQIKEGFLATSVDEHKDQTYFLYRLFPEQLPHILFPVGHLNKTEVRVEAAKRKIAVANKKDSVGICFIGDINVHDFLYERLGENPGDVVDVKGNVIGKHNGLWFYTIGQRHGFSIQTKSMIKQGDGSVIDKHNIPPFYVIRKLPEKNQLVVGFGVEAMQAEFKVTQLNWLDKSKELFAKNTQTFVRIRHTGELNPCKLSKDYDGEKLVVTLETPIEGIAYGQSAVFYIPFAEAENNQQQLYKCVSGGIISA